MVQRCSILLNILVDYAFQSRLFIVSQSKFRVSSKNYLIEFQQTINRWDQKAHSIRNIYKIEQHQTILFFQFYLTIIFTQPHALVMIQQTVNICDQNAHSTRIISIKEQHQTIILFLILVNNNLYPPSHTSHYLVDSEQMGLECTFYQNY